MSGRRVLVVVPDLFFATRIATTAQALDVSVEMVGTERALERCREWSPDLVILELDAPGDPLAAARALKADPATRWTPLVGFYSHVDLATRDAGLAAGVEHVMPRSAFTARLPAILRGDPIADR